MKFISWKLKKIIYIIVLDYSNEEVVVKKVPKKYEDFEESENIFKQMFREKHSVDCHYMVTRTLNLKFL